MSRLWPHGGGQWRHLLRAAFSGLFAAYWRSDARGAIVGMTRYVNKGHIARAALEASAYQTREVLEAMEADSGVRLTALKVDGGMVFNDLLMQFQSDILDVPVIRPKVAETTALAPLTPPAGSRLLEGLRRAARQLGRITSGGRKWKQAGVIHSIPAGRKQSRARSIGLIDYVIARAHFATKQSLETRRLLRRPSTALHSAQASSQ